MKGDFFIALLALRIRFRILKVLKDHNLLGKMSVIGIPITYGNQKEEGGELDIP